MESPRHRRHKTDIVLSADCSLQQLQSSKQNLLDSDLPEQPLTNLPQPTEKHQLQSTEFDLNKELLSQYHPDTDETFRTESRVLKPKASLNGQMQAKRLQARKSQLTKFISKQSEGEPGAKSRNPRQTQANGGELRQASRTLKHGHDVRASQRLSVPQKENQINLMKQ